MRNVDNMKALLDVPDEMKFPYYTIFSKKTRDHFVCSICFSVFNLLNYLCNLLFLSFYHTNCYFTFLKFVFKQLWYVYIVFVAC